MKDVLKQMYKHLPKKSLFITSALLLTALAAIGISGRGSALLGGDRPVKPYSLGTPGFDHVTFNSFTGVPNIGDERKFFSGKIAGAPDGFYDPMNGVRAGDEILMRVYVHNGADSSLNASGQGIARNTKVRVVLPTGMAQTQVANAFISADNAQPKVIEDTLTMTSGSPAQIQYMPGTATVKTNFQDKALSDEVVKSGVLIGDDNLSGNVKGCFEFTAVVTFKVKVVSPSYSLEKKVRKNGTETFTKSVEVKPGEKVDFVLAFKNVGSTNLNNVVLGDRLPEGMTYQKGTSQWNSGHTGNQWKPTNDNVVSGGVDVGAYAPGGAAFLKFTAQVPTEDKLQCGVNQLVNRGFAKPKDQGTIEDTATVIVKKECKNVPMVSCDLLDITKGSNRTITISQFKTTATNGATFKDAVISWGDNTTPLTTNNPVGQTHQYGGDGPFTVSATARFTVNGQEQTATSTNCAKTVSFAPTPPVTPPSGGPQVLPITGPGEVLGIFTATTIGGAVAHRLFWARRFYR